MRIVGESQFFFEFTAFCLINVSTRVLCEIGLRFLVCCNSDGWIHSLVCVRS
jgi:hypothetical protein